VLCPAIAFDFSPESHPFLDPENLEGARTSRNADFCFGRLQPGVCSSNCFAFNANSAGTTVTSMVSSSSTGSIAKTGCKAAMGRILYHLPTVHGRKEAGTETKAWNN